MSRGYLRCRSARFLLLLISFALQKGDAIRRLPGDTSGLHRRETTTRRRSVLSVDLHSTVSLVQNRRRELKASNTSSSRRQLQELETNLRLSKRHRHLSRYELVYRLRNGFDLQRGWSGDYDDLLLREDGPDGNLSTRHTSLFGPASELLAKLWDVGWGWGFNIGENQTNGTSSSTNSTSGEIQNVSAFTDHHRRWTRRLQLAPDVASASSSVPSSSSTNNAGGIFNSYQSVPLSQGYGTHIANVWVGSPSPQRKTVIVDTGSHFTAFPCKGCQNCGRGHHTDPYFDPQRSTSFHQLHCDECTGGVICENGRCQFSQSYTEGSSWDAVQVKDLFYCGGMDVLDAAEPLDRKYSVDFMFGCMTQMSGLFITQLADGIMGMSAHQATLPKQLWDHGILEHNMFAMCFRRELGTSKRGVPAGSMTMGGVSTNLDFGPIVYARNTAKTGWYTVYVKAIYVRRGGGQSAFSNDEDSRRRTVRVRVDVDAINSGKGVIVDSGTTDTYLNKAVAPSFREAWRKATGKKYSHLPLQLSEDQLKLLPTVLVQCHAYSSRLNSFAEDYSSIAGYAGKLDPISPNDLLIAIPATSYMDYSPITKMYTSRLYFTETNGGVLGSNAMQGHNVVFDWANGRVGFAESSCTYDKEKLPKIADDEGYASDCQVSDPILSISCLESVDRTLCKDNPTNIALLGTEKWSAIVENPGTSAGITCLAAAQSLPAIKNVDDAKVDCNGRGTCEESRPCQLTCSALAIEEKVTPKPLDDVRLGCGDSFWSTCDRSCMQTRIKSMAYSDGHCHEVSRVTRPCHIDACAREDPCLVPFLMHAVLAFRGLSVSRWSTTSDDLIAVALTRAAAGIQGESTLFDEGDVSVRMALPWYLDEDTPDALKMQDAEETKDAEAHGVKIVLEVSIVNRQNATTRMRVNSEEEDEGSLWRNITDRFIGGSHQDMKCNDDGLHDLATQALDLRKAVIMHPDFVPRLIEEMSIAEAVGYESPFAPLYGNEAYRNQSRVLTAWSVRNGLEEEINFFGPTKPYWYMILRVVHSLTFFLTIFLVIWSGMGLFFSWRDYIVEGDFHWQSFVTLGRHRYNFVETSGDDQDAEDQIMGRGRDDIEVAMQSAENRRLFRRVRRS